jgi:hypothetical protein
MSELVFNNPTMNCCGRPRSECTCRNHATEYLEEVQAMTPQPSVYFHGDSRDDCIDFDPSGLIPATLNYAKMARNEKAQGSNADLIGSGTLRAGRGREPDDEESAYWTPRTGAKILTDAQVTDEELEDLSKEIQKRLALGSDYERETLGLPIPLSIDDESVTGTRKSRTATLVRQKT